MEITDPKAFDESVSQCFVCKSTDIAIIHKDFRGNNIYLCSNCKTQFMNPQYSDKYLEEYYSGYTASDEAEKWREALLYGHGFYLDCVEAAMKKTTSSFQRGKLFDFGCGNGVFLEVAKSRGWSVEGYDVDPNATQKVEAHLNSKIHSGDFFAIEAKGPFDLIVMHQVLEHLKDPIKYLEKLSAMLSPQGYMFIAVPNIQSLSNRIKFFLEKKGLRKKRVGAYYDTSHHLFYYDDQSLKKLLTKMGFDIVYTRNCHKVYPGQGHFERFYTRNFKDHLISNSAFFVVAKKR